MPELRLLSLNTWGGRVFEPLMELLAQLAREGTHVLCLQEVYDAPASAATDPRLQHVRPDLLSRLRDALPNYQIRFAANGTGVFLDGKNIDTGLVRYGNALLVREDVCIDDYRVHVIGARGYHQADGRSATYLHTLQVAALRIGGRLVTVGNFHGLPLPGHKLDTPARLLQSERLLQLAPELDVLCGDFNLEPSTRSIGLLEGRWRNLICEFAIPTTRSRLNPYFGTPQEQRYADYAFVSEAVGVDAFRALEAQVSDHLGLLLSIATRGA